MGFIEKLLTVLSLGDVLRLKLCASVRAIAGSGFCQMAACAEELKRGWEAVASGPFVHLIADLLSVAGSVVVDVVKFKDVRVVFAATNAAAPIIENDEFSKRPRPFGFVVSAWLTCRHSFRSRLSAATQVGCPAAHFARQVPGGASRARFLSLSRRRCAAEAKPFGGVGLPADSGILVDERTAFVAIPETWNRLVSAFQAHACCYSFCRALSLLGQTCLAHFLAVVGSCAAPAAESGEFPFARNVHEIPCFSFGENRSHYPLNQSLSQEGMAA